MRLSIVLKFRNKIHYLEHNNVLFYTYVLRKDKAFTVVIKKVYPSALTDKYKNEIERIRSLFDK